MSDTLEAQLEDAAAVALGYLRSVVEGGNADQQRLETARFLLQINLAYRNPEGEMFTYTADAEEDD